MARFDTSIYNPATAAISRAYGDIGDTFDMLNRMRWKEEQMEQARLDQQRADAAKQAMSEPVLLAKAREIGYENLNPMEKATLDIAREKAQRTYTDPLGNVVTAGNFPTYGPSQPAQGGFEAVQSMQAPMVEEAVVQEGIAPQFSGVSQRVKQSPSIQMEREKANIELEKEAKKAEFEKAKARPVLDKAFRSKISDMTNINDIIDDTVDQVGFWTTGLTGAVGGYFPATESSDMRANLSTIKADAAFSTLQSMRDASPTGGALGAISERELGLLQNARSALDESQSEDQLKENLKNYKRVRTEAIKNVAEAYKDDYGQYPEGYDKVRDVLSGDTLSKPVGEMSTEELLKALEDK